MPLYMDLHKGVKGISKDEIGKMHQADLRVQDKYGVEILKFWINEDSGTVFCLFNAPNKEACNCVHEDAHGLEGIACEIIEVQSTDVLLIMGNGGTDAIGQAVHTTGQYDNSVRTFLFTDIVGSTDLTQSVGDQKAMAIIRKHNEIVRSAVVYNDGKEVKHTGDGIMACFFSAFKAVRAASDIQQKLQEFRETNPEYPLHVRIGLNTGEPVTEGGDFFGVAVQLAARICNAASANQVLVSNVVKDLCMGKALEFYDRGTAELKGFTAPISVYELAWQ